MNTGRSGIRAANSDELPGLPPGWCWTALADIAEIDAGVAALERARANLKRYRAAVLKAAVEGELSSQTGSCFFYERSHWKAISLGVDVLEQGWSPKCESGPASSGDEWAVIKTTAIQALRFLEDENKRLPSTLAPRPNLEIKPGDVLITRAGPRNRAGITCSVRACQPRLILCDKAYRLRCKSEVLIPGYLELALNSPPIVDALDDLKTGISDSGVNLTQSRFLRLELPIPPLEDQREIEAEVQRLLSVAENSNQILDTALQRCHRLRQSILKQAFEGKLVAQDPADEPASVLLERIAAQRRATASLASDAASGHNTRRKRKSAVRPDASEGQT